MEILFFYATVSIVGHATTFGPSATYPATVSVIGMAACISPLTFRRKS